MLGTKEGGAINQDELKSISPEDESIGEGLLKLLDLSQSQVATLLGVSPQAVSKGLKEDGFTFLGKERRAQRLYNALLFIGGDRFALSAAKVKDASTQLGWGPLDDLSSNSVRAADLYEHTDEIWVVSDSPGKIIDWKAMKRALFEAPRTDRHKVIAFFLSTLEGAEEWAEILEREAIRPAIRGSEIHPEQGQQFGAYVFLIVTNLTAFSGDFVLTNPGSACMGVFAKTKSPGMYYWTAGAYTASENANAANEFIRMVSLHELGKSVQKANFFPSGAKLTKEAINFPPHFIDGLIAKRGKTFDEDKSEEGREMSGGILREQFKHPKETQNFNKFTKFCAVFLLSYKRKPGESFSKFSNKTLAYVQKELDRLKEDAKQELGHPDSSGKGAKDFWAKEQP